MAYPESRVKREQIRKRRNNLLKRLDEFWRLYSIRSWVTLEMPNGWMYTYRSHPHIPAPTDQEMREHPRPVMHKTPADYLPQSSTSLAVPQQPGVRVLGRRSEIWHRLSMLPPQEALHLLARQAHEACMIQPP
ncbi:hypothetical protein BDV33DRAFT_210967 [Aspergillus novoparasiticus]|uniref:MADS-box domain-containing protein n=1 Tax=Aspergillus novoparasiticus TaxID=986946 RepID=A0A5N6E5S2_9EURO|nr:hypothetical protein BDV33DRAFT_210967 [Aspergillus novoparasiticus]